MKMVASENKVDKFFSQQDNAPSHKTADVMRCISKNTNHFFKWPACSPDLAVCDYFVFNQLKTFIQNTECAPKTLADLRMAICMACAAIDQDMLNRAIGDLVPRRKACIKQGGLRFEHTL